MTESERSLNDLTVNYIDDTHSYTEPYVDEVHVHADGCSNHDAGWPYHLNATVTLDVDALYIRFSDCPGQDAGLRAV